MARKKSTTTNITALKKRCDQLMYKKIQLEEDIKGLDEEISDLTSIITKYETLEAKIRNFQQEQQELLKKQNVLKKEEDPSGNIATGEDTYEDTVEGEWDEQSEEANRGN